MKVTLVICLCFFSALVFAKSSKEERSEKKYELTYQSGLDYRIYNNQVGAMYFLDADNLVGFKVGDSKQGQQKQTNFSLQYKHYAGNSFYVAGELFYLNTLEDEDWISNIFLKEEKYSRYTSLGAGIRIGNQWTWKYFTLGCDWIGIGQRAVVFRREAKNSDKTTFTLLNLIVGISF